MNNQSEFQNGVNGSTHPNFASNATSQPELAPNATSSYNQSQFSQYSAGTAPNTTNSPPDMNAYNQSQQLNQSNTLEPVYNEQPSEGEYMLYTDYLSMNGGRDPYQEVDTAWAAESFDNRSASLVDQVNEQWSRAKIPQMPAPAPAEPPIASTDWKSISEEWTYMNDPQYDLPPKSIWPGVAPSGPPTFSPASVTPSNSSQVNGAPSWKEAFLDRAALEGNQTDLPTRRPKKPKELVLQAVGGTAGLGLAAFVALCVLY